MATGTVPTMTSASLMEICMTSTKQPLSMTVWRSSIGMVITSVSRMDSTSFAMREASSPTRRLFSVPIGRRMMRLNVSLRSWARARSEALAKSMIRKKAMTAWAATNASMIQSVSCISCFHSGPWAPARPFPARSDIR